MTTDEYKKETTGCDIDRNMNKRARIPKIKKRETPTPRNTYDHTDT